MINIPLRAAWHCNFMTYQKQWAKTWLMKEQCTHRLEVNYLFISLRALWCSFFLLQFDSDYRSFTTGFKINIASKCYILLWQATGIEGERHRLKTYKITAATDRCSNPTQTHKWISVTVYNFIATFPTRGNSISVSEEKGACCLLWIC